MCWACVVVAGASVWAGPARAQLLDQFYSADIPGTAVEPGVTVLSRLHPDYDYLGVHVGSFYIRPEVQESAGYDDNVFGTPKGRGSPLIETNATVQVASDWSRNSVRVSLNVDDHQYPSQSRESYTNWTAAIGGTYEIGRDVLALDYQHQNLNQTPRDLDTPRLDAPIPFQIDDIRAGYRLSFNRLFVRPEIDLSVYSFQDGTVGGTPYPQRFRDRTVITPGVLLGYELSPRRNVIAVIRDAIANYRRPDPGGVVRDYNDVSILAGLDYDGGGLWRYRLLAGYEARSFTSRALKSIQAPIAELTLIFNPSGLTTLTGIVTRKIQDSSDETTTGYTETSAKLSVDHEYLRNVLLHAEAGIYYDQYPRGQGTQTLYEGQASVTWLMNRNMRLAGVYSLEVRNSTTSGLLGPTFGNGPGQVFGGNYVDNVYLLKLSLGL